MRFELNNPFTEAFGFTLVRRIQTCGIKAIGCPYAIPERLSLIFSSISYDVKRRAFYFKRDEEFRRLFYDKARMDLRNTITWLAYRLPYLFMKAAAR